MPGEYINELTGTGIYNQQWIESLLVQVLASFLLGTKPYCIRTLYQSTVIITIPIKMQKQQVCVIDYHLLQVSMS